MAIKTMQALINGQTITLTLNSSTGKYEAEVTSPADSSYPQTGHYFPVSLTATDTAGNSTTIDSTDATFGEKLRLFNQEHVKPTIQITAPSASAYVTNSKPTITFKLLDNANGQTSGFSGVDTSTCVVKINGTAVSGAAFTAVTGGFSGTLTPSAAIADGSVTVTIDVKDFDGNAAETASCTFTIDTVAPTLNITAPTNGLETNQDTVTVTGATDDATSKPVAITIKLNGTDQGEVSVANNGAFSKSLTLAKQQSNTIEITATDAAGKTTTVTRTVVHNAIGPKFKSVEITPNPVAAGTVYKIIVEVE